MCVTVYEQIVNMVSITISLSTKCVYALNNTVVYVYDPVLLLYLQSYQNVNDESSKISPSDDINSVADQRGTEREAAEQLLTDYFVS